MSQEPNLESEENPTAKGPGAVLKAKRESLGLSLEDIASKVHLRPSMLSDLEADVYDPSVSTTFVKGYIRLYAKHINLDAGPLLEQFENLNTVPKQPAKLRSFSQKVAKQASDARLMMVTYAIIAIVIALLVIWWIQQDNGLSSQDAPPSTPAQALGQASGTMGTPSGQPELDNPGQDTASTPEEMPMLESAQAVGALAGSDNTSDSTGSDESDLQQLVLPAISESSEQGLDAREPRTDAVAANLAPVDASMSDGLQDASLEAQGLSVAADDIVAAASGTESDSEMSFMDNAPSQTELVFTFSGDCWVNVTDATGEVIAYGVKVAGRVMPVSGVAPFEIVLGAPQSVGITIAGEPVDMGQFPAGRTARFSLPREAE